MPADATRVMPRAAPPGGAGRPPAGPAGARLRRAHRAPARGPARPAPPAPRAAARARPAADTFERTAPPPVAPRRPPVAPRRRRGRGALWLVLLLVALLVAYPLSLGWVAWSSIEKVPAIESSTSTPGTTFLLVGSDSRAGLTDEQVSELATGTEADAGGQRTDTILLLHVPSGGGPSVLVSLPRDSFVTIPGNGENKLNAAFAFGGPQLLAATVEAETGIGIDSYVETGFAGFAAVVEALGGIEVCPPAPLQDPAAGIDLPAGCQEVQGPQALGYVRSRQTDATGDLARVQRQREVLGGIMDRTLDPGLLLNPPRAYRTADAGGSGLRVDEGTGPLGPRPVPARDAVGVRRGRRPADRARVRPEPVDLRGLRGGLGRRALGAAVRRAARGRHRAGRRPGGAVDRRGGRLRPRPASAPATRSRSARPFSVATARRPSAWATSAARSRSASAPSPAARMRAASRPALRAAPTPTVATGTPAGIWTMDSSESIPSRCFSGTGTPTTGSGVTEASIPGRWAAPPAPATTTRRPAPGRGGAPGHHVVRHPVRGDDVDLVGDAELGRGPRTPPA